MYKFNEEAINNHNKYGAINIEKYFNGFIYVSNIKPTIKVRDKIITKPSIIL